LEPLHGYIKQENLVVKVRFPYIAAIQRHPAFLERGAAPVPSPILLVNENAMPARPGIDIPILPPKKVTETRGIFPIPSQRKVANAEPAVWDESQWIE
jgi:hypothetical protein